ncbi:class II D-tagatose-bisphosphate aldolase non-catalytic subunit, partial [Rhizobium ruizarguesonis]
SLVRSLDDMPGLVFEAHSTDYQPAEALSALVDGGFAILKVGPGLTFALREALYGLDAIADVLAGRTPRTGLVTTMEKIMVEQPTSWAAHYGGSPDEERLQRHFSYSDRIRYYWPDPRASAAVGELFRRLPDEIPETLISQYLGRLYSDVVSKRVAPKARELCLAAIDTALAPYSGATANR